MGKQKQQARVNEKTMKFQHFVVTLFISYVVRIICQWFFYLVFPHTYSLRDVILQLTAAFK